MGYLPGCLPGQLLSQDCRAPKGETKADGPLRLPLEDSGVFFQMTTRQAITHKFCGQPNPKSERGKERGTG